MRPTTATIYDPCTHQIYHRCKLINWGKNTINSTASLASWVECETIYLCLWSFCAGGRWFATASVQEIEC